MNWKCKIGFHCLHTVGKSTKTTHNGYEKEWYEHYNCCRCPVKMKRRIGSTMDWQGRY